MNRGSALAVLLALAGALALRAPKLDTRPLHNDEAVNAVKVSELWQHGRYAYDPSEYHGPTLHYATLPFLWLSGARDAGEIADATLRLAPVAFGIGLILLLLPFVDGLGRQAVAWAACFTAVSPAMVFYSRYFIHEILLVFFAALSLASGWRYVQSRQLRWALLGGAGLGLMYATKETFVFSVAAAGLALAATLVWNPRRDGSPPGRFDLGESKRLLAAVDWKHVALGVLAGVLVAHVLFSSFFTNLVGPIDSVRTYLHWFRRAGGHSPHIHQWSFYLERLTWFHPARGPVWSEGPILLLAVVGAGVSLLGGKTPLHRFLACYTISLTAIYSMISYKTPWCLLNFWFGMILLAGVGASALVEYCRAGVRQFLVLALLVAQTGLLSWEAWRASFPFASSPRNPYTYAQTTAELARLVERVGGVARVSPAGMDTVVKVIAPDSDYWPLPWQLRRFHHVGWYDSVPADPYAPMIIAASSLDARLDERSNKRWIMAGLTQLRPGVGLELYVELELWKQYVATLPREPD